MGGFVSKSRVMSMATKENSKKMALLIGVNYRVNYPGLSQLRGCHNDVEITKRYLMKLFEFQEENITVLIDNDTSDTQPTGDNIRSALLKLVESANPGDVLFVHFSGHGDRQPSNAEDDDTGYDEFVIAADDVPITDDDFRTYVNMVPVGCRITIVVDCCHSGGMIEAAKEQIGDSTKENRQHSRTSFETIEVPPEDDDDYVAYRAALISNKSIMKTMEDVGPSTSSTPDAGVLLSACQSYQKAQEKAFSGTVYGAFTNAIVTVIEQTQGMVKNRDLVLQAWEILQRQRRVQRPGLYCSDLDADALYLC